MSFRDDTWDGYFVKKVFSDENGVFFKDGPKYAAYYHNFFLGYFKTERDAKIAFFEKKGIPKERLHRW